MSIKISELPSASSVTSSDAIPIVQSGTTKKVTVGTMVPAVATSITSSSTNDEVAGAKAVYDSALQVEEITSLLTYTMSSGKTMSSFSAFRAGGFLMLSATVTYTSTTDKVVELFTLTNISDIMTGAQPVGRTYDSPATTTVAPCAFSINATTHLVQAYPSATSRGAILYLIMPMPTITPTRSLNLTKGENTGSLVGMGDRAEVTLEKEEQPEEITETKSAEVDKLETSEGSGDNR